jgi:hypothetical protein
MAIRAVVRLREHAISDETRRSRRVISGLRRGVGFNAGKRQIFGISSVRNHLYDSGDASRTTE